MSPRFQSLTALGLLALVVGLFITFRGRDPQPETALPARLDLSADAPTPLPRPMAVDSPAEPLTGRDPVRHANPESGAHPRWPASKLIERAYLEPPQAGKEFQRVTLLQPAHLPYPVRIEERGEITEAGDERILAFREMVADHLVVRLDDDLSSDQLQETVDAVGGEVTQRVDGLSLITVKLPEVSIDAFPKAMQALREQPGAVDYVEPDYIVRAHQQAPSDEFFSLLWGLNNTGQSGGLADADIDAPEAWEDTRFAPDVIVAVTDSGVRATHNDLEENFWRNPNELPNGIDDDGNGYVDDIIGASTLEENGNPDDDDGHGTHVAGTVGAAGDNGIGITGVAWDVQLMILRFLGIDGGTTFDAVQAIDYARLNGASIINASWGGPGASQSLEDAIAAAGDAGILFVAAAGNSGNNADINPDYPSAFPLGNIISVASTTRNDTLSGFSNFGATSVDLGAPGSDIASTYFRNDDDYVIFSGTSMAAPHVSGILALLKAKYPNESLELKTRLLATVDLIPALDGRTVTGGRANLRKALLLDNLDDIPRFTEGLSSLLGIEGESLTLTVSAAGAEPLTYSWFRDDLLIPGATGPSLTIGPLTAADDGPYRVRVSNSFGNADSNGFVTVAIPATDAADGLDAPQLEIYNFVDSSWDRTTSPALDGIDAAITDVFDSQDASAMFARIQGAGTVEFDWRTQNAGIFDSLNVFLNGDFVAGIGPSSSWRRQTVEFPSGENFLVWVYFKGFFSSGSAAGLVDQLIYLPEIEAPAITLQPQDKQVVEGRSLTLTAAASGSEPLAYQWRRDGLVLAGHTSPTLTLAPVKLEDQGGYSLEVSNAAGSTTSDVAAVQVIPYVPLELLQKPQSQAVTAGGNVSFEVVATGNLLSYSWHFNDPQSSAIGLSPRLDLTNVSEAMAGRYFCLVSDGETTVQCSADLTVNGTGPANLDFIDAEPTSLTRYTSWLGDFDAAAYPYIQHDTHGWLYAEPVSDTVTWLYDFSLGYLYTSATDHPYFWSQARGGWLFYQAPSTAPRWFYDMATEAWFSVQ